MNMTKKSLLISALSFLTLTGFSQEKAKPEKKNTFEIQAKGTVNSTWLFSKNISDLGDSQDFDKAWGFNYGLAFNAYFGNVGFGVEGLMGNHMGGYAGTIEFKDSTGSTTIKTNYKSNVNLKLIQVPVLFKLKSANGAYLEVGPEFNMISSADYKRTGTGMNADTSVTTKYSSSYFSAILGFGIKIRFGESPLSLDAGLRLNCSFTDLKGIDGLGRELSNTFYYPKTEPTYATSGGLLLSLVYKLNK
jgi:hypothetical protein